MRVIKSGKLKPAILIALTIMLVGCAGTKIKTGMNAEEYFKKAETAFKKKRWESAIDNFNMAILNSPGGELADDAQFKLGECYFNKKEFLLAVSEYQQLTERYSYSPFVEEAYYKIALSYYKQSPKYPLDQVSSLRALQSFQDFIDSYPASELRQSAENQIIDIRNKLARKVFESGKLYRKMEEWQSAIIYLDKMLEEFYDTDWVVKAKLEKAHCYIKLRQFDQYQALIEEIQKKEKSFEEEERLNSLKRLYERELLKIEKEKKKLSK